MATIFGKILRGAVSAVTAPINAAFGTQIASGYTGQTGAAFQGVYNSIVSKIPVLGSVVATDKTNTNPGGIVASSQQPNIMDQVQAAVTQLFGGVANQVGTAAGNAAGIKIQTVVPWWLWPLVFVLLVGGIFYLFFKKRRKR